jgi:RNA polymerase sigma factor (sigma-70 family)
VVSISLGDHRARVLSKRDALIQSNLDLVPPIARRIHQTLPPSFDLDDLIQIGAIGLLRSAVAYRPDEFGETPFSAFARPRIRGAILDAVRRRYSEHTSVAIEHAPEPSVMPSLETTIDRKRLRTRIDRISAEKLSKEQAAVLDAYYSPEMPSLSTVAVMLDIPEWRVYKAHSEAVATLRTMLQAA